MEKKALLAIFLSLAVWLAWSYFFMKPVPQQPVQDVKKGEAAAEKKEEKGVPNKPARVSQIKVLPAVGRAEQTVEIATDRYHVRFSSKGGAITSFNYRQRDIELVVSQNMFGAKGTFDFPIYMTDDEFSNGSALDAAPWFHQKISDYAVKFYTNFQFEGNPVQVEKIFTFTRDGYSFTLEYRLINRGGRELILPARSMIVSPSDFLGPDMDFENSYNTLNSIYDINNSFEKGSKGGGLFSKEVPLQQEKGSVRWVGLMSRYFLLILIPDKFSGTGVVYDGRKNTGFRTGMYVAVEPIKAGGAVSRTFKVYAGEKNKDLLTAVDKSTIDAADVSKWIEPIRDLLIWCLMKINSVIGNFGWSLVIFSLLTKIALLPLTQKSTESMKKLQLLNPQISEMREKFKDKPEILNKKIMELYKKNKVNPASGCLPLLLQMPFFFALYSALINSIDLWHAPFTLWITDLSMPDTVFRVFDFNINIMPVVMTGTTYLQQKMTSGDAVGQQQKMMMFMPLLFVVIFWNMPSGLVLYWVLQNVLQILNQLYINRKGKDKPAETA